MGVILLNYRILVIANMFSVPLGIMFGADVSLFYPISGVRAN